LSGRSWLRDMCLPLLLLRGTVAHMPVAMLAGFGLYLANTNGGVMGSPGVTGHCERIVGPLALRHTLLPVPRAAR
jgi:hypothetical protein